MIEDLEMTPSTSINAKAINKRHRERLLSYGMTHNGIVPAYVFSQEVYAALYEIHPDLAGYPHWLRRSAYNDFYRNFKKSMQDAYGFKCMSKRHLRKSFGSLVDEQIDVVGDKFFVFPKMTKNIVALQGCEDMNHYENENPNRRQARHLGNLVKKEAESRAAFTADEQLALFEKDLRELTSDGTDGAV